jgi:hypothetical protein
MHSRLSVSANGLPLGLAAVKFWTRKRFKGASELKRHCLGRIQPVDATIWLNRSAGVSKFSVFRGRSLSRLATAFSLACE